MKNGEKDKEIILGKFGDTYESIASWYNWVTFPFGDILRGKVIASGVIGIVSDACNACSKINFLLDNVELPLSNSSHTCKELLLVISKKEWLDKTQFWLANKRIEREGVLYIIKNHLNLKGYFNNIK